MLKQTIYFLESVLYSYAQIFFSNRLWLGAAILLISFFSPQVGILGFLGVVISNLMAFYFNYEKDKIHSGFYGFNGILIGASIGFFFVVTPKLLLFAIVFILLTFFISAALEHLMANVFNLPGLSLPFIFALYVFLIFISNLDGFISNSLTFEVMEIFQFLPEEVINFFRSLSLIILQPSIPAGIMLAITILIFSRVMFVNMILIYSVNIFVLNSIYDDPSSTLIILTSFNAILTSFALGGSMIIVSRKTFPLLILSNLFIIIFTAVLTKVIGNNLLPVLVLPFNIVSLSTIYSLKFRQEHSDLALLYFKPGSPEENFYFHKNQTARFEKFKYMFPELPFWGTWKVSQGFDGEHTHQDEWKYAWDFVMLDEKFNQFTGNGKVVEDYYCFDTPVIATLKGEVVNIVKNIPDNKIGEANLKQNWGNTVVIDHGEGLFSAVSHLKRNSISVEKGDKVEKGEILGKCGNSGRSPLPHLHFQFQLTDKIGDETYKFPLSFFIQDQNHEIQLKSFDYPKEGETIHNIETHSYLKDAFNFKLGDKFILDCQKNDRSFKEVMEVKVDILNNVYLENNAGSKLFVYLKEKVFYSVNYVGKKDTALYYFYLSSISVPLGYNENLKWKDQYPISLTVKSFIKYLSQFFLLFSNPLKSEADLFFLPKEEKYITIKNTIKNSGAGIFSFYKKKSNSTLTINDSGKIESFGYNDPKTNFKAEVKAGRRNLL
ncbi:MAG: peptidoglycan DD-metalloendopeptidase family protein [Ignavibacteriae bacterium]|nr:peptidoglycan DD-metalloendopeptidase family protein [Ignavibacteriota bacterium]